MKTTTGYGGTVSFFTFFFKTLLGAPPAPPAYRKPNQFRYTLSNLDISKRTMDLRMYGAISPELKENDAFSSATLEERAKRIYDAAKINAN